MKITRSYIENVEGLDNIQLDYDKNSAERPSWIHITTKDFKPTYITIQTDTNSSILYKRFTGNFYYPYDMSKDEELKFYEKYAEYYDEYTLKNNLPMAVFLLEKMSALNIVKSSNILDLGAGTGIFSDIAAKEGYNNLTLLDISEPMLNSAKKKSSLTDKNFIVGDITSIDLSEKYDVVVSVMMFDAIAGSKIGEVLDKIAKHMSDSGYILLIEDKERDTYKKLFTPIEQGIVNISKEKGFSKWFFIGRKK